MNILFHIVTGVRSECPFVYKQIAVHFVDKQLFLEKERLRRRKGD